MDPIERGVYLYPVPLRNVLSAFMHLLDLMFFLLFLSTFSLPFEWSYVFDEEGFCVYDVSKDENHLLPCLLEIAACER